MKRFKFLLSKPEYLNMLLARTADSEEFADVKYTTAVSLKKAWSNIRYRYPDRTILSVEEVNEI